MAICSDQAWNNLVMRSDPASYEPGSSKRAAAISALFQANANYGGLNSFLTGSYDLDAEEVVHSLRAVGAIKAATQLELVLLGLKTSLPIASQDDRCDRLDKCWSDHLDKHDTLTREADDELSVALEKHVAANEDFYRRLG